MAETIEGSFSFNLLDNRNNIYLVKGDSPISLIHFPVKGVYVFASTDSILWRALIESELFIDVQKGEFIDIILNEGDILKINSDGGLEKAKFNYTESFYGMRWYDFGYDKNGAKNEYLEEIKHMAAMYGEEPELIQDLYEQGFTLDELEEMVYTGEYLEV